MNGPPFLFRPVFWIEFLYSMVVIISCLVIYFKTREMYELSSHSGIKYFGLTFLCFAIAYFFRFFFSFFFRLFISSPRLFRPNQIGFRIGSDIFVYASTMAALYLLLSLIWKNIKDGTKYFEVILHLVAIIITLLVHYIINPAVHIGALTIIFFITTIVSYSEQKHSKKKHFSRMSFVYLLVFLLWIFNIIALEVPWFLLRLKIALYLISSGLFLLIFWRVVRRRKNGSKK